MKIQVGRENSTAIELRGSDLGSGPPVLLVHGWPLSRVVWERQVGALLQAGFRVITYDRRGCGKSSPATTGYDLDTLAEDLRLVLEDLDLRDCSLVGHAMGCSEIIRYLGSYGSDRVRCAAFVSPLPLFPVGSAGLAAEWDDDAVVDRMRQALAADRHEFLHRFLSSCYNHRRSSASELPLIGERTLEAHWMDALNTSQIASRALLETWRTDLLDDLPRIATPCLVLQGSADRVFPSRAAGRPLAQYIAGAQFKVVSGAPHGLTWTHADLVNAELNAFIRASVQPPRG